MVGNYSIGNSVTPWTTPRPEAARPDWPEYSLAPSTQLSLLPVLTPVSQSDDAAATGPPPLAVSGGQGTGAATPQAERTTGLSLGSQNGQWSNSDNNYRYRRNRSSRRRFR